MKILVTGKNGQIGWELQRTLSLLGDALTLHRGELNLADPDAIRSRVREIQPALIVNAAAYTAVDQAESEPDLAYPINATAPGILAEEARTLDTWLLHYSTDYVFDGAKTGPYEESDPVNPLSVYGASKLGGEQAIAAGVGAVFNPPHELGLWCEGKEFSAYHHASGPRARGTASGRRSNREPDGEPYDRGSDSTNRGAIVLRDGTNVARIWHLSPHLCGPNILV